MWDEYAKNPDNPLEWQTAYLRFMFELEDASGDGSIDVEEFTSVCSCYGLDTSECREAFHKMGQVSKCFVNYYVSVLESFVHLLAIILSDRVVNFGTPTYIGFYCVFLNKWNVNLAFEFHSIKKTHFSYYLFNDAG